MRHAGKEPFPTIYMDGKDEGKVLCCLKIHLFNIDTLCSISFIKSMKLNKSVV